jgi:sensor histidine kinase regulating citrate/malate metabolism
MTRLSDKRSNVRVRALMAATGEGLIALDREGAVRLMNEAAQEMLGKGRADVIEQPVESASPSWPTGCAAPSPGGRQPSRSTSSWVNGTYRAG